MENIKQARPVQENPCTINTNIQIKIYKYEYTTTYPIKSYPKEDVSAQRGRENQDTIGYDEINAYKDLIKENIEYDILAVKLKSDIAMLDEIVDLLTETVCSTKDRIIIAGDVYSPALVKSKLLKLNSEHIEYVVECMKENTTDVRNIKKYLWLRFLIRRQSIDSYFRAKVNHDLYGNE